MDKKIKNFLNEKITGPYSVKLISDTNNFVWLVESGDSRFVLKEKHDKSTDFSLEQCIFEKLKIKTYINTKEDRFLLYNYIPGRPLSDMIDEGDQYKYLNGITDIISIVSQIPSQGAGQLDHTFNGNHVSWSEFLVYYMEKQFIKGSVLPKEITAKVKKKLFNWMVKIKDRDLVTIPMDLNLKNFIINESQVEIINLPVVWRGDRAAPYGELAAHIYRTPLWPIYEKWIEKRGLDRGLIDLYAMLMAYTTLVYVARFSSPKPLETKPWGNKKATFLEIINYFSSKL